MDIFNLSPDAFENPNKTKKGGEIYMPSADKGRDGVYTSVIRFVPNINDVPKSRISKFYAWLEDPETGEGFSVDSPRTIGKKCIINDTYWKLKKSQNIMEQERAEKLNTMPSYYSLIQVVKDDNQPELNGKIMVFKFGTKINEKIETLLKPAIGNPTNPFDLFEGKVFVLNITKKQKWNNYDRCEFMGDRCAISIDGAEMKKTPEDMERIKQYLRDNSPELAKYEYKEWTPEQETKVHAVIRSLMPDAKITEKAVAAAATQVTGSAPTTATVEDTPAPASKPAATEKPVTSIDDLYAGL